MNPFERGRDILSVTVGVGLSDVLKSRKSLEAYRIILFERLGCIYLYSTFWITDSANYKLLLIHNIVIDDQYFHVISEIIIFIMIVKVFTP